MGKRLFGLFLFAIVFSVMFCACSDDKSTGTTSVPKAVPLDAFADWDIVTLDAEFSPRMWPAVMVFNNKLWVIAGRQDSNGQLLNDVWNSTDGEYWEQVTAAADFAPRYSHSWAVYNNKMWIIGGRTNSDDFNNDVWYSSNGIDWTQATSDAAFSPRSSHKSVAYGGKLWVISGYGDGWVTKDAWYTTNGADWIAATTDANFVEGVVSFACFTFDDKMWVACGESNEMHNEIYYSSDGKNWAAILFPPFLTRVAPTFFTFRGMMYIGGGYDDMTCNCMLEDMWRSADGYNWEQVTDALSYGTMMKQAAVNFKDEIYLIGGSTDQGTGYCVNSVYISQEMD